MADAISSLPSHVNLALRQFIDSAQESFGDQLVSAVLFGSAAEGRLRPTSDVNLIVVLREFVPAQFEALGPALQLGRAAIRLEVMFLLTREIAAAMECFAEKFSDVLRRHEVLYGPDPFLGLCVPRNAEIVRLRQALLNLTLRLRAIYAETTGRPEQVARAVADAAGPLRASAASLLEIRTGSAVPPREALEQIVEQAQQSKWTRALGEIPLIRQERSPSYSPSEILVAIIEIAEYLRNAAERLHESV